MATIALNCWPLWLALGIANVVVGVLIALRPGQSQDLRLVVQWCRDWLVHGVNPYPGPEFTTNYPPYALAFLFPLALVPLRLLTGMWAISNVVLATIVGWLALKLAPVQYQGRLSSLTSLGVFLCWESLRIGLGIGQFTLLAAASGFAAVAYRGWIGRGILLSIALIKPQVGMAFVLWAILNGSLTSVLMAAVPISLGTILFAVRLGQNPLAVAALYGDVLQHQVSSPTFKQGALEMRPLLHDVIQQPALADSIDLTLVVGTLALLVLVHRRMSSDSRAVFLLPLTCVWTLMSVYHPTYDLVLLWPAWVAISNWQVSARSKAVVLAAMTVVQLTLVVDVPGLWWTLNGRGTSSVHESAVTIAMQHFNRLLVLAVYAGLITVAARRREPGVQSLALQRTAAAS